jgi:phosphoglycolate phosphatase
MNKPDSIIFDMDGTLWDGLDIYVESWNRGLKESNMSKTVRRDEIAAMVGWESQKVLDKILPGYNADHQQRVLEAVNTFPPLLLNELGGILYEGVKAGVAQLASKYHLFIVSNCAEGLIRLFMQWANIEEYVTDEIAHGVNSMPKHYNIKTLIEKYKLQKPVYVGDTAGDSEQSELAGVPFVFLSHGFGTTEKYSLKFDNFKEFTRYFMVIE